VFQLSSVQVEDIKTDRVKIHREKLSSFLSQRDIGWDDLDDDAQKKFLDDNENRAVAYGIETENARAKLAYCFFWSGDAEAFEKREDVQEILTAQDVPAAGKVRRLHAIAYDVVRGTTLFTKAPPPEDKTFTPATVIQFGKGV
jgi:hypothetical protein